jgi:hypothetical protein
MLGRNGDHQVLFETVAALRCNAVAEYLAQASTQLGLTRLRALFRNKDEGLFAVLSTGLGLRQAGIVGFHSRAWSLTNGTGRGTVMTVKLRLPFQQSLRETVWRKRNLAGGAVLKPSSSS